MKPKIVLICALGLMLLSSTLCIGASDGATIGTGSAATGAAHTNKYVIFREDDVAPNADFAELQAINQMYITMNVPVVMGIIPHAWPTPAGNQLIEVNNTFLEYMRSLTSDPLFQFAQHGYTHRDLGPSPDGPSEFYGRPYAAQYEAIKQGRDEITQAFGVTPTSFLPPFDKTDNNTLTACEALGFTEYSTGFRDFNQNEGHVDGMRLDTISIEFSNASFNQAPSTSTQTLQSLENATNAWLSDPASINTWVVLFHPADFEGPNYTVNTTKLNLLASYIDYLEGTGRVQFTTLSRSITTTGTGVTSPSSKPATAAAAIDFPRVGLADYGAIFAAFGAVIVVLLAAVFLTRVRNHSK